MFSLSRIYGDIWIDQAVSDLRIDIEERASFEKFMRDSISYAVGQRFNHNYPIDINHYTGEWNVEGKSVDSGNDIARMTYGTSRVTAYKLIENALNLRGYQGI